ncbi:MAG: hypothetical protein AB8F95_00530 [Bacteroidia bacterium]
MSFIQKHFSNQQQIARILGWVLAPVAIAGVLATLYSAVTVFLLVITVPLCGVGLFAYFGYVKIGRSRASHKQARRTWKVSLAYNIILCCVSVFYILAEEGDPVYLATGAAFQAAMAWVSHYTSKQPYEDRSFEEKIATIGMVPS